MKITLLYSFLTLALLTLHGFAEQFVFIDDEITWTRDRYDYPPMLGPENWESPVDYVNGNVYVRYEVIDKPSTIEADVQLCLWQNRYDRETCGPCRQTALKDVYYLHMGVPSGWWKKSADIKGIDFTKRPSYAYFMHKDGGCGGKLFMDGACGAACYTKDDITAHVPIKFKATVIVVSAGSALVAPAQWAGNPWSSASPVLTALGVVPSAAPVRIMYKNNHFAITPLQTDVAALKIIAMNGGVVTSVVLPPSGLLGWDGTNRSGQRVARGMYQVTLINRNNATVGQGAFLLLY